MSRSRENRISKLVRVTTVGLSLLLVLTASLAWTQERQTPGVEEFVSGTQPEFDLGSSVSWDRSGGYFAFSYSLKNHSVSRQNIKDVWLEVDVVPVEVVAPTGWHDLFLGADTVFPHPIVHWFCGDLKGVNTVRPGAQIEGLGLTSRSLPGIVRLYARGFVPMRWYPEGQAPERRNRLTVYEDSIKRLTVGPSKPPPPPGQELALLDRLTALQGQALEVGWIADPATSELLDKRLEEARQALARGDAAAAKAGLQAYVAELDTLRGRSLDDNAWNLLRPNAEYLWSRL